jgi:hypothetical protein
MRINTFKLLESLTEDLKIPVTKIPVAFNKSDSRVEMLIVDEGGKNIMLFGHFSRHDYKETEVDVWDGSGRTRTFTDYTKLIEALTDKLNG